MFGFAGQPYFVSATTFCEELSSLIRVHKVSPKLALMRNKSLRSFDEKNDNQQLGQVLKEHCKICSLAKSSNN